MLCIKPFRARKQIAIFKLQYQFPLLWIAYLFKSLWYKKPYNNINTSFWHCRKAVREGEGVKIYKILSIFKTFLPKVIILQFTAQSEYIWYI